ncbi:MAG: SMP-30/gluconolactonase/LRE family protein [Anaerolineales bacterium]
MRHFSVDDMEIFASDIPGAEGIAIANDGRIFIGAEDGWIYLIMPNGEVSQYVQTPGRPLGIAIDRQDNLFVCDWDAHGVYKITPDREVSLFADSGGSHKMQFPNFCVFDTQGNLYVSDTGTSRRNVQLNNPDGKIFRISSTGECELFGEGLYAANGLAIRQGESAVYVIQTLVNNVLRLEIKPDGKLGTISVYARNLDSVPDGMAFTEDGDLLVVTGLKEILYRIRPNLAMDIFLQDANAEKLVSPANPAFGGANLGELYITNLGGNSVSRIKGVPRGQKLYHQLQL